MPRITEQKAYDGAERRLDRLGLRPLWDELLIILSGFKLLIEERRDANGAAAVRGLIDDRFEKAGGWQKSQTGDVDWVKCRIVNGTRICLGVEIQISARSDLLIVDVVHLRDQINAGMIDVGVLVTPSNALSVFLTDRVANFSDALKAVERARATDDLPLIVLGLAHGGAGPPLAKRKTRQSRSPGPESKVPRRRPPRDER
jgi:hypothetical protein